MKDECLSKIILVGNPNGQKIDTRGSGVPPIFEWQIASYDRPPSGERSENFSMRSVQIRAHMIACAVDLHCHLIVAANHPPNRVDEATAGQPVHAAS